MDPVRGRVGRVSLATGGSTAPEQKPRRSTTALKRRCLTDGSAQKACSVGDFPGPPSVMSRVDDSAARGEPSGRAGHTHRVERRGLVERSPGGASVPGCKELPSGGESPADVGIDEVDRSEGLRRAARCPRPPPIARREQRVGRKRPCVSHVDRFQCLHVLAADLALPGSSSVSSGENASSPSRPANGGGDETDVDPSLRWASLHACGMRKPDQEESEENEPAH